MKWEELLARLRKTGKAMRIKGTFIAATAMVHGLAIVFAKLHEFGEGRWTRY